MAEIKLPTHLEQIQSIRRDLGNLLFHFTRGTPVDFDGSGGKPAFDVLRDILEQECLKGGTGFIKGSYKCVCFTESPISELAALFHLNQLRGAGRYEPYGIAVKKEWLFSQGGRPAIYGAEADYSSLYEASRFRHVKYEPPTVDFTWEREWRIHTDKLRLDPSQCLVVVPTANFAVGINHIHSEDLVGKGVRGRTFQKPKWMVVSLDLFGLKAE